MILGTLLHDMNQRNDKMQRIDRSRAPVNVPQQSYGTRVKVESEISTFIFYRFLRDSY
jgi:hypothetical protein